MRQTSVNSSNQKGQALLLMLAFVLVLSVAMIYLFNTSQLLAERTQAKVLADHAAYNTAVKQAQLLNANAYMNKAKIANQLATAQAVSVASWAKHHEPIPTHTGWVALIPGIGPPIYNGLTTASRSLAQSSIAIGPFIKVNNIATRSVSEQQNALNQDSIVEISKVHSNTVSNSSIGAGFSSTALPVATHYAVNDLDNGSFIKQYQGDSSDPKVGRQRLKDVVLASRDPFTRQRRADSQWNLPSLFTTGRRKNFEIHRRGGTEISNDLNQWKGVDTFSLHYEKLVRRGFGLRWVNREDQTGYGSTVVRSNRSDNDSGNRVGYSNARAQNKDASNSSDQFVPDWDTRLNNSVASAIREGETGVPRFWDLDSRFLSQEEPTLPVVIRVRKGANSLDTTTGISNFKVGDQLDIDSKNSVTAISSAEVYFERPIQDRVGRSTYLNRGRVEKASLINPYWQVRLASNSATAIVEANTP